MPKPKPLADPGRARHRRRVGHRQGDRAAARRRGRLRGGRRPRRGRGRGGRRRRSVRRTRRSPSAPNVTDADAVAGARSRRRCWPSAASTWSSTTPGCRSRKPLLETTEQDWDLQHDVMAKGSFLVSRAAAKVHDRPGHGRRHRLHLQQELGLRRPEQRRVRRGQGRPGPPGPAARGRARRARHPGQRREPRRRRPRFRASSPRAGARSAPRCTAYPSRSWARTTRSARCSSARCCRSTSRRRSSRWPAGS